MKIRIGLALTFLCSFIVAQGAPPTDESISQMMTAMHAEKMLDQVLAQMNAGMEQGFSQSLQGRELNAAQREAVENFKKKLSGVMKDELSFAKMKEVYLQAYRETLTQDEVNSIIAFYSSPAGKTVVDKIPLAMQRASVLMQGRIGPMIQRIQSMQQEFAKELANMKEKAPDQPKK